MKCPVCNARFGRPRLVATLEEAQVLGHLTSAYSTEAEYILYHNGEYRCTKCGHRFSEREAYLQHV